MATTSAPGYQGPSSDSKSDTLHEKCWAENESKDSFIFIEQILNGIVRYKVYDLSEQPYMEFRNTQPLEEFLEFFSYGTQKNKKIKNNKWIWHDKTPFPFSILDDKTIVNVNVKQVLSHSKKIAKLFGITGEIVDKTAIQSMTSKKQVTSLIGKLKKVLDNW